MRLSVSVSVNVNVSVSVSACFFVCLCVFVPVCACPSAQFFSACVPYVACVGSVAVLAQGKSLALYTRTLHGSEALVERSSAGLALASSHSHCEHGAVATKEGCYAAATPSYCRSTGTASISTQPGRGRSSNIPSCFGRSADFRGRYDKHRE